MSMYLLSEINDDCYLPFPDFSRVGNRLPISKPLVINPGSSNPDFARRPVRQDMPPAIIPETPENLKKIGKARKWVITVFLCLCGAGGLTWMLHNQRVSNSEDPGTSPRTSPLNISDCHESGAFGPIGEHVCYAPASNCPAFLTTEPMKSITIRQGSLTYYRFVTNDYVSVFFTEDKFNVMYKGWFVDYNISREVQPLRIAKLNMTCYDIGLYTVTFHYGGIENDSCDFDINTQSPEIELLTHETEDFIYINCTMSNVCSDATLAVYINDGNHTYYVLATENNCNSNTSIKRKEMALRKSQFSSNHKVICKPLIDDFNLVENLTKTIRFIKRTTTLCNESQCPNLCNVEEQGYYFQHPMFCNKFYQCEYPTLHRRPCPENQQWSPEKYTCTHANEVTDQCNNATKKYDPPLATGNVKMCGGS